MNLTLTNLSLFETTKEQRGEFCKNVIEEMSEGTIDPLKVHLQIKCLEDLIKQFNTNLVYKYFLISEAEKYGKNFEHLNAKFEIKEMGIKYDYFNCGDPIINDLLQQQTELEAKIKERQTLLKAIPISGQDILIEDEIIKVYPPSKTSTTSISVNLK